MLLKEQFVCSCPKGMAIFHKEHAPVDQKSIILLAMAEKYEMVHKFLGYETVWPISTQGGISTSSNITTYGNPQSIRPSPFPITCYIYVTKLGHKANQTQHRNAHCNKPSQRDYYLPNRHNSTNAGIVIPSLTSPSIKTKHN